MNNNIYLMSDIYYLWVKYQMNNVFCIKTRTGRSTERLKKQLDIIIECKLIENMVKGNVYNGQTKAEYAKNFTRVNDIITKSNGDEEIAIRLAGTQAVRITDEWKAINRAMAARDLNQEHIFNVFFQRAYELGTVTKQDYRQYQLEKLGI
jgi:hypothetical protein